MLLVKLDTGFNIEVDFPIVPFHKRLIAWCIDLIILVLYFYIVSALMKRYFRFGMGPEIMAAYPMRPSLSALPSRL